jgi:hypothetical protein
MLESTWHQKPEEHLHQSSTVFNNKLYFCDITGEFKNFEITREQYYLAV